MICYTLQTLNAWKEAELKGFLTGNFEYVDKEFFLESYLWLMNQMTKRLNDYNGEVPIWLWLSPPSINFNETIKDDWVLLEVEMKEEQLLISNFDAWHHVLNNWHLDEENSAVTKEESWEYIFDKDKLAKLGYDFDKEDIQAVTGKIQFNHIKVLKYIVSTRN